MLKTLLCLILGYSLLTISAFPARATSRLNSDTKPSASNRKDSSCSTCTPKAEGSALVDAVDRLAVLGRTTQIQTMLPIQHSLREGTPVNFVSTATGHLAFAISDLELIGTMPVTFQRSYNSRLRQDRGLGNGWSFAFDDWILIEGERATLTKGDGSVIAFRADEAGSYLVPANLQPSLHQSFKINGDTITEEVGEFSRIYKKKRGVYRLAQITDRNGNLIRIGFDSSGNLSRVSGSNHWLKLEWSNGARSRLLGLVDSAGRRVTFKHEGTRLGSVIDTAGNEWSYKYSSAGLTTAKDPFGRVLLSVTYDRAGRAVEAGDAAGSYSYEYDSSSAVSTRTVVADPLGIRTVYEHRSDGALTSLWEHGGQRLLEITHDSANRPTRFLSLRDGELSYGFDEQNRLTQITSSGASRTYTYDDRGRVTSLTDNGVRTDYVRDSSGNIVTATSSDPNLNYRAAYDPHGRLLNIESATGPGVTNEYDANGNVTAFSTEINGRTLVERDATGQIKEERFSSGEAVRYERDARGLVTKKLSTRGHSITFERDSSGALTGLIGTDNTWIRARRDVAGRIVELNSSTGKTRRFAYDARGGLTEYRDSSGRGRRFNYDNRGRLENISDDKGNKTKIQRDGKGAIERLIHLSSTGQRSTYDRAGRLVAVERARGPFRKAAEFVSIGYETSAGSSSYLTPQFQDFGCMFSDDFGFNPFTQDWFNCWDPFGGFWGGGEGWEGGGGGGGCDFFDPSLCTSFFYGTYEECVARERQICERNRTACGNHAVNAFAIAMSGCIILTHLNPPAGVVCAAAAFLHYVNNLANCDIVSQNCFSAVPNRCRR